MRCEDFQKSDVIDKYISGKLSEEKRESFARHYFECDRCFEELRFRESLMHICREHGDTLFADVSDEKEAAHGGKLTKMLDRFFPRPMWERKWVYAAVSVAVILILIPLFSTIFVSTKYEHLADIKPCPYLLSGLRSGASEEERLFHEGMRFYSNGEYGRASQRLEKVVAIDSENVLAQFFLGVSFLMDTKPGKAIQSLEKVTTAEPDSEIFHWYLGQAYLKKGDGEKARQEFVRVRELDGNYRSEAEALIRKIDEMME